MRGGGGGSLIARTSEWMDVLPGNEQPFDFSTKGKMRHRVRSSKTHGGEGEGRGRERGDEGEGGSGGGKQHL